MESKSQGASETLCGDGGDRGTITAAGVTEFDEWPKFAAREPSGCSKLCSILVPSANTANWDRCMGTIVPTPWELMCCSDKAQVVMGNDVCVEVFTNLATDDCGGFSTQELHAEAEGALV